MPSLPVSRALPLAVLVLSVFLPPRALAQVPSDPAAVIEKQRQQSSQQAAEWLASPDPRIRAWGAYLVLRDQRTELVPVLLSIVSTYNTSKLSSVDQSRDEQDAMFPVLDALIELSIQVPAADAARLFPEFPAQSMILLSRFPAGAQKELLDIFRTTENQPGAWLAAGNLLAMQSAPGFAAVLLGGMTVHVVVTITDPGMGAMGRGEGGSCAGGGLPSRPGWPETGNYSLSESAGPGDVVLASGIDVAYYHRTVNSAYSVYSKIVFSPCVHRVPRDLARQQYLAQILNAPQSDPPLRSEISHNIPWSNEASYINGVQALILGQEEGFSAVAHRLQAAGLLTADEAATIRPKLRVTIWDQRHQAHTALPFPPFEPDQRNVTFDRLQ